MFLRLSHAPKLGAAFAFGLIATGIAVSQSENWDQPMSPIDQPAVSNTTEDEGELFGPPMPATSAEDVPVNLADLEGAVDVRRDGAPSDNALESPERSAAPDSVIEAPVVANEEQVPDTVRMIEMPRRSDELDELGRPVEAPDQYEVAALPSPVGTTQEGAESLVQPTADIAEPLVAPIPAPAYRRPIESYIGSRSASSPPQQTDVEFEPLVTESAQPYIQDGSWPRRLDQVPNGQALPLGQPRVVVQVTPTHNVFLTDWVEVETRRGGTRRVFVGQ